MADDAGALLVRSGLVSASALDEARAKVNDLGGTLGEQLVAAGVVTDDSLTDFYKKRLLVPQVNPNSLARLPAKVVAIIPSDMAIELRAIPVSLDADNNLTIAMSDPSDRHAVDEIAAFTGTYVVRAVATQMQIAWCLAHYYGHVTNLGQRLLKDTGEGEAQRAQRTTQPPARPRARGITGQVEASRHRAIVPGEAFVESRRAPPRDTLPEIEPEQAAEEPTPVDTPKAPRGRSVSGEIRVPGKRAPSIRPPLPDDSGPIDVPGDLDSGPVIVMEPDTSGPIITMEPDTSGPVMTIEADEGGAYDPVFEILGPGDDPTDRTRLPVPKRRRPADPDPPELAARAGEVQLATGAPIKKIIFDEPRIIIAEDLEEEARPRRESTAPLERSIAVSGEIRTRDASDEINDELASIFVELGEEDSAPSVIHDPAADRSQPVLLDRRREPALDDAPTGVSIQAAPPSEIQDEPSDVVVLDARKAPPAAGPRHRNTQMGIGPVTATTRARMFERTVPEEMEDQPTGSRMISIDADATRIDAHAAPPSDYDTSDEMLAAPPSPYDGRDTSQIAAVPAPSKGVPGPSGQISLDRVQRAPSRGDDDEEEVRTKPTRVMSAVELDEVIPGRASQPLPGHLTKKVDYDPADEGWGPPGTTIPPPLLGAIPGSEDQQSGVIPISDVDSAPLMVAPPVPPERPARAQSVSETGISRALEAATARVLELIHTLDHTTTRDQVVAVMIAHLAETHQRAGFFAARGGELSLFAITPRVPVMPAATLRLDRPSTLQDVVGTRLPYRGPMLDDVSHQFLQSTLGACPPEILLVPVAVRERVVGVLFGDNRMKHTFDDQLALAARAAGMALERILKSKRGER